MCQVHTGAYVSTRAWKNRLYRCLHQKHIKVKSGVSLRCARSILVRTSQLAPGKTDYIACHPRKTTATYILHVVPITTHTRDRRRSIGKKETKKIKEYKGRERKDKKATTRERKEKKRKKRKKRQDKKRDHIQRPCPNLVG